MKAVYCDQRDGGQREALCPGAPRGPARYQKERNKRSCRNKKGSPEESRERNQAVEEQEEEERNRTGRQEDHWEAGLTPLSPKGKAGTRPADSRGHSVEPARLCASLWMKMPLSLEKWSSDHSWSLRPNYITKTCLHGYMDFIATSWS